MKRQGRPKLPSRTQDPRSRERGVFFGSLMGASTMSLPDILPDTPQDPCWVDDRKVTHTPRSIRGRFYSYPMLGRQLLRLDAAPPRIHVFDKQVHHKVAGVILVVKILQQKART